MIIPEIGNTFAALDFETANQYPSSICSLGVVIVENGIIVDKIYELVRPAPNFYSYFNIKIHGITNLDTYEAPDFSDVWGKVDKKIRSIPVFAHNKGFDEGCLKAAFKLYEIYYPEYEFYCTYRLAKKMYPHLVNHKLNTVAEYCGFDLKNHHHALADAEACAAIALQIINDTGIF